MAARKISGLLLTIGVIATLSTLSLGAPQAGEATDKFHITAEESTACSEDAAELCSAAYPNEDRLLACMKANRRSLSAGCRPVFEEGIRRRHLE